MRLGGIIAATAIASSGFACSLLFPDDLTGGSAPAAADGASDAETGVPSDAALPWDVGPDSTDSAAPSLLQNGDFELGCAAWGVASTNTTLAVDPVAHDGVRSCRICRTSGFEGPIGMEQTLEMRIAAGKKLTASVYVRAPAEGGKAPTTAKVLLVVDIGDGGTYYVSPDAPGPLGNAWTMAGTLLVPPGEGTRVHFLVRGAPTFDACFLVDTAHLTIE